jgi:hypothetical protein
MTGRLSDVWAERDFPVLVDVTGRVDSGERFFRATVIAESTGLDLETVGLALDALERRGLVRVKRNMGGIQSWHVDDVAGAAYLITGLHPSGDDAVSAFLDALRQAADLVDDPDERSRLKRLGDAALSVSQNVLGGVLVNLATKGFIG